MEIFVPSFVRAARNIVVEREAFELRQKEERKKERENATKRLRARIPLPLTPEDLPPPEPINFWDLDEDMKVRILTASHIIITGVEKLYVKVAVTAGHNILAWRDSPIVSPSNPRWGNVSFIYANFDFDFISFFSVFAGFWPLHQRYPEISSALLFTHF